MGIEVTSPAFADRGALPERCSRAGGNVSPPLLWSGVPGGTRELAVLCVDPDAGPEPFLHWLVTEIDPTVRGVSAGRSEGRAWPNGLGYPGWTGPEPPPGDPPHRYVFDVYALRAPVALGPRPTVGEVRAVLTGCALDTGRLTGTFDPRPAGS